MFHKQGDVIRMFAQVEKSGRGSPEHVQTRPHRVRVIPERVHSVLLCDNHCILFGLFDESQQKSNRLIGCRDSAGYSGVSSGQVVQNVDAKLPENLVLIAIEFPCQKFGQLLNSRERWRG